MTPSRLTRRACSMSCVIVQARPDNCDTTSGPSKWRLRRAVRSKANLTRRAKSIQVLGSPSQAHRSLEKSSLASCAIVTVVLEGLGNQRKRSGRCLPRIQSPQDTHSESPCHLDRSSATNLKDLVAPMQKVYRATLQKEKGQRTGLGFPDVVSTVGLQLSRKSSEHRMATSYSFPRILLTRSYNKRPKVHLSRETIIQACDHQCAHGTHVTLALEGQSTSKWTYL